MPKVDISKLTPLSKLVTTIARQIGQPPNRVKYVIQQKIGLVPEVEISGTSFYDKAKLAVDEVKEICNHIAKRSGQ